VTSVISLQEAKGADATYMQYIQFLCHKTNKTMRACMGDIITQLEVVLYIILTVAIIHLKTKNWFAAFKLK
jgi:hypothetical protein